MESLLASGLMIVLFVHLPHFSFGFKNQHQLSFVLFQDVQTSSMIVMSLFHDLSPNFHSNQLVFGVDSVGYSAYFIWLVSLFYSNFDLVFRNQ